MGFEKGRFGSGGMRRQHLRVWLAIALSIFLGLVGQPWFRGMFDDMTTPDVVALIVGVTVTLGVLLLWRNFTRHKRKQAQSTPRS
jgi:hypothetical protein